MRKRTVKIYEVGKGYQYTERGIHLLNPLKKDIDDAIERALIKNFKTIFIHRSFSSSPLKVLIDTVKA